VDIVTKLLSCLCNFWGQMCLTDQTTARHIRAKSLNKKCQAQARPCPIQNNDIVLFSYLKVLYQLILEYKIHYITPIFNNIQFFRAENWSPSSAQTTNFRVGPSGRVIDMSETYV
jgi:hypothetical protein